jgi:hypothetical protein
MRNSLLFALIAATAVAQESITVGTFDQQVRTLYTDENGLPDNDARSIAVSPDGEVHLQCASGAAIFKDGSWEPTDAASITRDQTTGRTTTIETDHGTHSLTVRATANTSGKPEYIAADSGLYVQQSGETWNRVFPADGNRSWAPVDVRGVTYDSEGRLWFASPQGVGCLDGDDWTLYTGDDGLPYNDFTCIAAGQDGAVWFGTHIGAIRFDGESWEYRQGKRWLPDDDVRAIAVDEDGGAWIATAGGIAHIAKKPMTLAEKAAHYHYELEHYIMRTPFGYTAEASVATPGDPSEVRNHDSDNDGLWTAMYGAGECFAYGATGNPESKRRAQKAFEALEFLGTVVRGSSHEPPDGYVARTILPTSGPDPNEGRLERDIESQKSEYLWKVYEPRWPISKDGEWYWKSDTSSDELDGHYFFYALYYDLVAETEEDKQRVRKQIQALTDHLIEHDFFLIDHDGKPTRWGRFNPQELNHDKDWYVERGLNSLSMLSYLITTAHITGDDQYRDVAQMLIDEHGYAQNIMVPKIQRGIGTGNQSDDEMAFMCFYNLIKYTENQELKERAAATFKTYWTLQLPETNPFFNFCFPAVVDGITYTDPWGTYDLSPTGPWLEDAVETLKRFPLDRYNWAHQNDHRIDVIPLPYWSAHFDEDPPRGRGHRVNGKVIPVDERHFNHWNHDPYRLNTGGSGHGLASGAVYTLPYYMGLYHGFIKEE